MAETVEQEVRQRYGYLSWALDDPELGPILRRAAELDYDEATLQGELFRTQWWQSHSPPMREWERTLAEDPAKARRLREQKALDIRVAVSRLGLQVSPEEVQQMADSALRFSWSDNELLDALASHIDFQSTAPTATDVTSKGSAAAFNAQLDKLEEDYLVRLGAETRADFIRDFVAGRMTEEGVQTYFLTQAKSRLPHLAEHLDNGITVKNFFAPILDDAARLLEISPAQIDLLDDERWRGLVEWSDPRSGMIRPPTRAEASRFVRGMPEFRYTDQGRQAAAGLGEVFTRIMGRKA